MTTTKSPVLMDPDRVFPRLSYFIGINYYYIPRSSDDEEWFSEHQSKNGDMDPGRVTCEYFIRARQHVDRVTRFADQRQPVLDDAAIKGAAGTVPDAVKEDSVLGTMYMHRASLLTHLHEPCLQDPWPRGDLWRYNTVIESVQGPLKPYEEQDTERLQDGPPQPRIEFKWLLDLRRSLEEGINLLIATYRFGLGRFQDADKTAELVEKARGMIPEMTRLIVELLDKEACFEGMYATEHICDTLMNKRLRCVHWGLMSAFSMRWARKETLERTAHLKQQLSRYSMLMRNFFAYRYLEWVYGRPWKKLYLVSGEETQAAVMTEFMGFASTTTPLARLMFSVHPLPLANLCTEEICCICQESYQANDLLMELRHCPHRFHAWCVVAHFDQHNRYDNSCPVCRTSAGRIQDTWPVFTLGEDPDVCHGRDPEASVVAELSDHQIRHLQRRGVDIFVWPPPLAKHFWERERLAWLNGATIEDRIALFPDEVGEDEGSETDSDCDWD